MDNLPLLLLIYDTGHALTYICVSPGISLSLPDGCSVWCESEALVHFSSLFDARL